MTNIRFRAALGRVASYAPTPVASTGEPPRPLSANETPHGPLPGVLEAIAAAGAAVNRYPDARCRELTGAIARFHGVDAGRVLVGGGSVALLQALFQAFGEVGDEVVYAWRSFELYAELAELAGLRSVQVPLADGVHDLAAMADRVTPSTRMVVVCNPNNPTGTVVTREEIRAFLARVPSDCLVVLDEAYIEYTRAAGAGSGVDLLQEYGNLVVLRTFSKAYGLAGLRVGYLLAAADVVTQLDKPCLPYAVNTLAQRAAEVALGLQEELALRVEATVAERTRVREALLALGLPVPEAQGNFVWIGLGGDAVEFGRWCMARGVAVRAFAGEGVRVTMGTVRDNDVFLEAVAGWAGAPGRAAGRHSGEAMAGVDV
ncbi:histidinol-phosphate transaminase [Streptomyces sp. NPDC087897]|uniref:histidinol-phosphate transaminase n=1 Tax=Streptomyces sp. NPDC087897 TaxID=3365817 RepID=UPI0038206B08